jgi:type II secretory pathway pseudopilin PulG
MQLSKLCPVIEKRTLARAYSILEVLVSIAVLGIMFVSLYTGMSMGFAVIQLARENLRATQILQEKLETIRLYTWDQINTAGFVPTNFVDRFYATSTNDTGSLLYTGAVKIVTAPIDESYSNEIRQINIQVSWASGGVARKREMSTLVTRDGLQRYVY